MMIRSKKLVPVALLTVCLGGCGDANPKTAHVHGRITYNGKPVPNGSIVFILKAGFARNRRG